MTTWRIRDFHSADLDGILHLWESLKATNVEPVYALSEVLASCEKDHAVVAVPVSYTHLTLPTNREV